MSDYLNVNFGGFIFKIIQKHHLDVVTLFGNTFSHILFAVGDYISRYKT